MRPRARGACRAIDDMVREANTHWRGDPRSSMKRGHIVGQYRAGASGHRPFVSIELGIGMARAEVWHERLVPRVLPRYHAGWSQRLVHVDVVDDEGHLFGAAARDWIEKGVTRIVDVDRLVEIVHAAILRPGDGLQEGYPIGSQQFLGESNQTVVQRDAVQRAPEEWQLAHVAAERVIPVTIRAGRIFVPGGKHRRELPLAAASSAGVRKSSTRA